MSLTSLPTFPTLNKNHSLQPNLPSTSSKFGTNLVYNDASVTVAATEAVALAYAAVNAARHAVEESENGVVGEKNIGFDDMRRMRRRKRRKNLGCVVEEENIQNNFSREKELVGFLSSIEEAEICLGLKEGARIEVSKHRMTEHEGNSSISRRLAHGNTSLDKVLSNTRESKERLAHEYRGLVASIAARYQGKGLSFQDLTQEGTIGLLHGAEKFDPNRGCKLSTYVYWWIKQAILKALARKSRLVRLPGEKYGMVGKIAEAKNVLSKRLRRKPTYNEMAEVLNVNVSIVKLVSERSRQPISLDKAVFDQGNLTLKEIMPGPVEMIPEKMVERQLKKQGVVKLLNTLNKREAEILRLYFGLNGETPLSFEEIGKQLKLSRERIRQIHGIALSKLQQTTLVDSLKFYVV
ncbi:RNA polymerase sigma factor sigD, chloroplastic isoform X1 [Cicer arietinum]|uniref:RNA polymerase sigma factor sigD, chloroplastic n=1 Tax=Cicer arietinum TaxID=3827 RepID=A0A1S2Y7Q9_CICAR|nr:RNA polymerase sigma factor sigD, chloroplastic [Cicer arietinum]